MASKQTSVFKRISGGLFSGKQLGALSMFLTLSLSVGITVAVVYKIYATEPANEFNDMELTQKLPSRGARDSYAVSHTLSRAPIPHWS